MPRLEQALPHPAQVYKYDDEDVQTVHMLTLHTRPSSSPDWMVNCPLLGLPSIATLGGAVERWCIVYRVWVEYLSFSASA